MKNQTNSIKNMIYLHKKTMEEILNQLQSNLTKIEMEISNLDSRLNDLRALKQLIVSRLHKIAKDNFEEEFERKILHTIVGESPKSVSELAEKLNEKPTHVKNTLHRMNKKLYRSEQWTKNIIFRNKKIISNGSSVHSCS